MTSKKLIRHDLLFHPVHGLCRVDMITKQNSRRDSMLCYSLVPKTTSKMKVRFLVPASDLKASGFHKVISIKDANKILDYLRTGKDKVEQSDQTWTLARNILSFSKNKVNTRDQRKRQQLEHSVKGLVGELAYVLQMSFKKTALLIGKNLARVAQIDPLVFGALDRAAED